MKNNIKDYFVAYEQALALKKLGYDKQCLAYYGYRKKLYPIDTNFKSFRGLGDGCLAAPLKSQAFRWFMEEYGFYNLIHHTGDDYGHLVWKSVINDIHTGLLFSFTYQTYEEAENACIDKLIEIVKEQKMIDLIAEISGW